MNSVVLQPSSSLASQRHYEDTIENLVEQAIIRDHVSINEFSKIHEIYGDNPVPVWGVTPGTASGNVSKWERIDEGDVVLFAKQNVIFSSGVVTYKVNCRGLAEALWGVDSHGETWEFIYFLDEIKNQNISYREFNNIVGYQPTYIIQGFNVLDEEKSEKVFEAFDFRSENYFSVESATSNESIKLLLTHDTLDQEFRGKVRKEQSFLRKLLFGSRKRHACSICLKEYPIAFLVTAHIKKRSHCSDEEKVDIAHVVVPMCKFGCDELFERGYISVKDGKVITKANLPLTDSVRVYINNLIGNEVREWHSASKLYFDWHLQYHNF